MGESRRWLTVLLSILLFLGGLSNSALAQTGESGDSGEDSGDLDGEDEQQDLTSNQTMLDITATVPSWRVGDSWTYAVTIDARSMVEDVDDFEGASLEIMTGTANMTVGAVTMLDDNGKMVPAYRLDLVANGEGAGTFPDPYLGVLASGDLVGLITETKWLRVSDLAIIERVQTVDLDFRFVGLTIDVAEFTHSHFYDPAQELYDFPLARNDSWVNVVNHSQEYSGDSGPIDFDDGDLYEEMILKSAVTGPGAGPHVYSGCEDSTNVTANYTNGDAYEYRWWCPAVNNFVYWWTDDMLLDGADGVFALTGYFPAAAPNITVETRVVNRSAPLNSNFTVQVNISGGDGSLVTGELWLLGANWSFNTTGNSINLTIPSGNLMDDSPTATDWATHGVVVCLNGTDPEALECSVDTLTIAGSSKGYLLRERTILRMLPLSEVGLWATNHLASSIRV